jgi:CubicO group peptidase (beta-lactamase class C family)
LAATPSFDAQSNSNLFPQRFSTPAAGIAIAIDGQLVFTHIAGEATPGIPATDDTLWPLASISKLYTASAIMSLIKDRQSER